MKHNHYYFKTRNNDRHVGTMILEYCNHNAINRMLYMIGQYSWTLYPQCNTQDVVYDWTIFLNTVPTMQWQNVIIQYMLFHILCSDLPSRTCLHHFNIIFNSFCIKSLSIMVFCQFITWLLGINMINSHVKCLLRLAHVYRGLPITFTSVKNPWNCR